MQSEKEVEFATLQQGEKMIVMEYAAKVIKLNQFGKHLGRTALRKT